MQTLNNSGIVTYMEPINRYLFTERNPMKERLLDIALAVGIALSLCVGLLSYFDALWRN
jgi:hypothetical protein